jgi:uncharacterized membrane protein YdjX (TVP38/TMEM64 family)
MSKWWVIIFYLALLTFGIIYRDFVMMWIRNSDPSYLFIMILFSMLFATIPIVPFTIFGGLMGVKYGLILGLLINWIGSLTAAVLYFSFARLFLTDEFENKVKRFPRISHFQSLVQRNTFIAILIARLVPIIPPPIINIYSAISRISFVSYIFPTAIGSIPPMFFIAFGGNQLFSNIDSILAGMSLYGLSSLVKL